MNQQLLPEAFFFVLLRLSFVLPQQYAALPLFSLPRPAAQQGAFLLLPANIRIGPEDSLERAAACLQETAEDFLQAERLIRGKQQVSGGGI